MGERYYDVNEMSLSFSEEDSEWRCLCTFPVNCGDRLGPGTIRSLALLGAAVTLACIGDLPHPILPDAVPQWIRDEIKRVIPNEESPLFNNQYIVD